MTDGNILDEFYAVVVPHDVVGPLRWSPEQQAWLRRRRPYTGIGWADQPVEGDAPTPEQQAEAMEVAAAFVSGRECPRCSRRPNPAAHAICTDVRGDPAVYCVQRPSTEVVDADSLEEGAFKHWGSPGGCKWLWWRFIYETEREDETSSRSGVQGSYLYGTPLLIDEVLLLDWCPQCLAKAEQVGPDADYEGTRQAELRVWLQDMASCFEPGGPWP